MLYLFEDYALDTDQRELRRGSTLIPLQPGAFDLLEYLIANRERVVTKDDLIAAVWGGRIVSESALTTRINAARMAVGDSGETQRLIRTIQRKGIRFVGAVCESVKPVEQPSAVAAAIERIAVPANPAPALERPSIARIAERRQLTVLSCELLLVAPAGGRRFDPEDLREVIESYQRCVRDRISSFEGSPGQPVGKTMLVYFGYPAAHEDDAERGVRAALELLVAVRRLGGRSGTRLQARVGVSTGQVIVGDPGGGGLRSDAPVGEAPDTASQLQNAAQADTVLIDSATRRLIGSLFNCRAIEALNAAGTGETLSAWQVLGASAVESRFEALRQITLAPMIGRDEELELLHRRWAQSKSGEGRVVLISGEPGIGKSRLVTELQTSLQADAHERLRYFCSPNLRDSPLRPVATQIEHAAGLEADDGPAENSAKLLRMLERTSATDEHAALLADLLSLPQPARLLDLSPQLKREKTFEALLAQIKSLAKQRPALMLFEDVHWIDPSSHELLDRVVDMAAHLPLLLLITFRPEFHPPWVGHPHVTLVTLNRLGRREGVTLIEEVAGNRLLPKVLVDHIVERTDGVPLFVEELTRAILEAGEEERGEESSSNASPRTLAVPATLNASLMARLDRLGSPAKEVAQIGAAIGREFSYDLLAGVAQRGESELKAALDQLTESGLVSRRGTAPEATFTFKHALVQESAYETLLKTHRQQLHGSIAKALVRSFPTIAQTQPELVAHHFANAGLLLEAAPEWLRAGQQAVARSANIEAIAHLTRGLEIVRSLPASKACRDIELAMQISLGSAQIAARGYSAVETERAYARARELLTEADDARTFAVLHGLAMVYWNKAQLPAMSNVAEDMLMRAGRFGERVPTLVAHRVMAVALNTVGRFKEAREHGARAAGLYEPEKDRQTAHLFGHDQGVGALCHLAIALTFLGEDTEAKTTAVNAAKLAQSLNNANTMLYNSLWSSFMSVVRHDWAEAYETATAMVVEAERRSMALWAVFGRHFLGCSLVGRGAAEAGIAELRRGRSDAEKLENNIFLPMTLSFEAQALAALGQFDEALKQIALALQAVGQTQEQWWQAEIHRIHGEILLAGESRAGYQEQFRRAVDISAHQGAKLLEERALTGMAAAPLYSQTR